MAGPKKQLLEYLRDQYVSQVVVPIVEVNSFFEAPSDAFYVSAAVATAANTLGQSSVAVTVPTGESWLLLGVSLRLNSAVGGAIVAGTSCVARLVPARNTARSPALIEELILPALAGIGGQTWGFSTGGRISHPVYLEGGSSLAIGSNNPSAGAIVVTLEALVTSIGKDIR